MDDFVGFLWRLAVAGGESSVERFLQELELLLLTRGRLMATTNDSGKIFRMSLTAQGDYN